ncbi:MAG: hypothetical protein ACLRXR_13145 [Alistipes putredinis]
MKNFDLAAAKAGAPVCTRDGRSARIICTDCRGVDSVLALVDYGASESLKGYRPTGNYGGPDYFDLMMRDDDYAEKLARGEYGNHIEDKVEKVDREHLRRELSEKIMVAMIRELAGKSPHSTSSNITVYEAMAADAVSYADALLEELEKKK